MPNRYTLSRDLSPLLVLLSSGESSYFSRIRLVKAYSCRLRDQMNLIEESSDMEMLVGSVKDTGGVYFVTAFSGLLAPYWDRDAVSLSTCIRWCLV